MKTKRKHVNPYLAGCGTRRTGQAYMYSDYQKYLSAGYPLSYFLFDPPHLVEDPGAWGLCASGIGYRLEGGIWHALDWIGRSFYWNATDIMEEIVHHNGSGLLPLTSGIGKLGPGSRRLLFHPSAWLYNPKPYKEQYREIVERNRCPLPESELAHAEHIKTDDMMCTGLLWQVVEKGEQKPNRETLRKVGDTSYAGIAPIADVKPEYGLALFMWLPIDEIHVVDADETGAGKDEVEKALDLLEKVSNLPIYLTNA